MDTHGRQKGQAVSLNVEFTDRMTGPESSRDLPIFAAQQGITDVCRHACLLSGC